jgi:hypothetical protein
MILAALSLGWVVVSSCRDAVVEPEPRPGNGLSLTYADGSEYDAAGMPTFQGIEVSAATFAVAFPDSVGGLVLAGFRQGEGSRGDLFILQLRGQREGHFGPCGIGGDCYGTLLEDIDAQNLQDIGAYWTMTDGSVQVDGAGPERVSGSLADVVLQRQDDAADRTIRDGTFDVPLLSEEETVDIMQCFLRRLTGSPTC